MTDSPWERARARALFDAAADLPAHDRRAYLEATCPDEPALRDEVLALLALSDDEDSDAPIRDAVARIAEVVGGEDGLQGGQVIGPYRLDRELGHGGMGTVYLARRADDEFQRAVAIKVIRGWADDEMVRRFRIERQILASLDHPNIGRLLDGGATTAGLPYLVMEYVDGHPLATYCDKNTLSVNERIHLVETLCRAVHYAHERGIVHRDLKPSNVLVTVDGVPKLLDFGIARLFDGGDIDGTIAATVTGARRMTPEYASPEQALGVPVTTASDVYVLGLLLCELLTGVRPQRPLAHGREDAARTVAEVTPPRPSDAITRARRAHEATRGTQSAQPSSTGLAETCVARQTTPERLAGQLSGDLDKIVIKAISKEPDRRYSSAAALADDLRRYLDGEPVHARSASITYIARRRVARHWKAAVAGRYT